MDETYKKIQWPTDVYWPSSMKEYLESSEFQKEWGAIFTKPQWDVITEILKMVDMMIEFHSKEDDQPHSQFDTFIEKTEAIDAKLRNHRHDLNKQYSSKPEF